MENRLDFHFPFGTAAITNTVYSIYTALFSVYLYIGKTELTENGNVCLFAANGNRNISFFSDQPTINGNRHLLFQQMCQSMLSSLSLEFIDYIKKMK
jgi:hypothetical protein